MFEQIPRHEHAQVHRRAAAFAEPVITLGIRHVVEPLAQFDQAIHQSFGDLQMGVGFTRAVDDQQVSPQTFGEVDRRGPAVSVRIRLGGLHVDLLEPRIVELRLRLGATAIPT